MSAGPGMKLSTREQFERFQRYYRELERCNAHRLRPIADVHAMESMRAFNIPTVTMTRETLLRIRANYWTLLVLAAFFLGDEPENISVGDAFFRLMREALPREDDDDSGAPPREERQP